MLLFIISPLFLLSLCQPTVTQHSQEVLSHFNNFTMHHKKHYRTPAEKDRRLAHFAKNHQKIQELNAKARREGRNVTFGWNKFADKNRQELSARNSKIHPKNHTDLPIYKPRHPRGSRNHHNKRSKRQSGDIPDYFDLRDIYVDGSPVVGPVKDQEQCGCCWAFATTAITEAANTLYSKSFTSLSDQEICDCADSGDTPGCVGGDPRNGLKMVHLRGQSSDGDYPYEEYRANTTGNCVGDEKSTVIQPETLNVYRFDQDYAEEDIMENLYLNHIPTAVYFRVGENFEWYTSGVLQSEDCYQMTPAEWHSVAIVGYGTSDDGVPYWLVRNSWNSDWGLHGYVKIRRGVNWCLIESHAATAMIDN